MSKNNFKYILTFFVALQMVLTPVLPVLAQEDVQIDQAIEIVEEAQPLQQVEQIFVDESVTEDNIESSGEMNGKIQEEVVQEDVSEETPLLDIIVNTVQEGVENLVDSISEYIIEPIQEVFDDVENEEGGVEDAEVIIEENIIEFNKDINEGIAQLESNNTSTSLSEQSEEVDIEEGLVENDSEVEESGTKEKKILSYAKLMRQVRDYENSGKNLNKQELASDLLTFIETEKDRLDNLNVSNKKQKAYFKRLKKQLKLIDKESLGFFDKTIDKVKSWFGIEDDLEELYEGDSEPKIELLEKPASFGFADSDVKINKISKPTVKLSPGQVVKESLKDLVTIETVDAYEDSYLPILQDVQADGEEVIINSEIRSLAEELNNNPVDIFNFVRNNISYEPYFGSKKGNLGCLHEKICNDVDTNSLLISLYRAAGIPARYKKGIAVVEVEQLKNLLGVDEFRAVYSWFSHNKISISLLGDSGELVDALVGQNLSDLEEEDFADIENLAFEWTHTEIFYDYDERGANINNDLDLQTSETTEQLRAILQNYYKKQWIPVEAVLKDYGKQENQILVDIANFDSENFYYNYFQYQGDLNPMERYAESLQNSTGLDVTSDNYHSYKTILEKEYEILPPTLPYLLGEGEDSEGNIYTKESWSVLPNERRQQVMISLLDKDTENSVYSGTFYGNQINNTQIELYYEGATEVDKNTIESFGGIHATPAELVDIRSNLVVAGNSFLGQADLSIGQNLIMQFDYIVNGETVYNDQKFSTAGNQEGIYIVLSRVQDNYILDNFEDQNRNSKILLEGNSALAREYLRNIEEQGDILKKSLDYNCNTNFSRAVVTQNRVLNQIDNVPTTFDFSGLTLDAATYISDVSARGDYLSHRKDFRLLWGLYASYYEGQVFDDITGLEGISTVMGLQYAYGNPGEYTVHVIDQNNENLIDSLALTDNTKANMHTDVQAGNTIITPDKFVEDGTWRGILYISLDPKWTGTYAIGEQVANGGWTKDGFEIIIVQQNGEEIDRFINEGDSENFIFADSNNNGTNKNCRILRDTFLSIINADDWENGYGLPCYKEDPVKTYDQFVHGYTLTTDAIKFESQEWDYWIYESIIKDILYRDGDNDLNVYGVDLSGLFKFNVVARTFSWYGKYGGPYELSENEPYRDSLTVYFSPAQNDSNGYVVYGLALEKLASQYNNGMILDIIGFPTSNRLNAAESSAKTSGKYQNFIGGQIYIRNGVSDKKFTYFVPKEIQNIFEEHECYEYGTEERCGLGTYGPAGFPIEDPSAMTDSWMQQVFENRSVYYNPLSESGGKVGLSSVTRRTRNKDFAEVLSGETKNGEITDIEAFAEIANYAASITDDEEEFVRDLTMLFVGLETIGAWNGVRLGVYSGKFSEDYQLDGDVFSDTGFKFKYNDSHYCINSQGISNQLYHSMGGFNIGYFYVGVNISDFIHEKLQKVRWQESPFGTGGSSKEDSDLTMDMGRLADELEDGDITKDQVGREILSRFGLVDLDGEAKTREELKNLRDIRWNFREYEKQHISDSRWFDVSLEYVEDMKEENGYWVQHYKIFSDYEDSKSIWDSDEGIIKFYDKEGVLVESFTPPEQ